MSTDQTHPTEPTTKAVDFHPRARCRCGGDLVRYHLQTPTGHKLTVYEIHCITCLFRDFRPEQAHA